MTKNNTATDETITRFKSMSTVQRIELIENGVDAVLDTLSSIDAGKKSAEKAEMGQLGVLREALKDYALPVKEPEWDKVIRPIVAERLGKATKAGGGLRYANAASRDVMVHLFKVATMGLTLAKHDKEFASSQWASGNLKKYALEVGPKLQAAIDPETGEPRLRSIPPKPKAPKKLPKDNYYFLIGVGPAKDDINNSVLSHHDTLADLAVAAKAAAKRFPQYTNFRYVIGKLEKFDLQEIEQKVEEPQFSNAAVFGETVSNAA